MNYIITIGREYGSGGRFIAQKVAKELGLAYYDDNILQRAAEESGISEDVFKNFDEKKDNFFGGTLGMYSYDVSLGQKVILAQFDAIKKISETESCVIVGRCADYVLADYENLVTIFICAPLEDKINRAVKYYNIDGKKAANIINKKNKKRKSYYDFYTDREWGLASNYDLCINSKIGIDESVSAIVNYVKTRFKLD